jgi:hypothetical protein
VTTDLIVEKVDPDAFLRLGGQPGFERAAQFIVVNDEILEQDVFPRTFDILEHACEGGLSIRKDFHRIVPEERKPPIHVLEDLELIVDGIRAGPVFFPKAPDDFVQLFGMLVVTLTDRLHVSAELPPPEDPVEGESDEREGDQGNRPCDRCL